MREYGQVGGLPAAADTLPRAPTWRRVARQTLFDDDAEVPGGRGGGNVATWMDERPGCPALNSCARATRMRAMAKYDSLCRFLRDSGEQNLDVSMDDIADMVAGGCHLPPTPAPQNVVVQHG